MIKKIVFVIGLYMVAYAGVEAAEDIKIVPVKVGAHTYYIKGMSGAASEENQGFMSNAGFVVTRDGVLVFDTLGTPVLAKNMITAIAKITKQPIKRVIISHFHADHIYGMQTFKAIGAELWAHSDGQIYLASELAQERLQQRREVLEQWIDENTKTIPADKWLSGDTSFEMGGLHFKLSHVGPAHSPEDMALFVEEDGVLFSGDLVFKGRVPYVGNADSRLWLKALDKLIEFNPKYMIPGHGSYSSTPVSDLKLTRDYLSYLRKVMGDAVKNFESFDETYEKTDWSKFSSLPAFVEANRPNAYNTFLLMESESMAK